MTELHFAFSISALMLAHHHTAEADRDASVEQLWLLLWVTPVLFLLWQVKMSVEEKTGLLVTCDLLYDSIQLGSSFCSLVITIALSCKDVNYNMAHW